MALCLGTVPAQAAFTGKRPVTAPEPIIAGLSCKNYIFALSCIWPKYKLRFTAPANANVFEHDTDRNTVVILASQNDTLKAQGVASFAMTIDVKDHPSELSLGQMDLKFQNNANYMYKGEDVRSFGQFKLIEKSETTFMTFPAIRYVYEADAAGMPFKYIDYHALNGQREYRIMFRSAPKYYEQTSLLFESFIKSFLQNTDPSTIPDTAIQSSSSRSSLSRSSRSTNTTKRTPINSGSKRSPRLSSAASK